MFNFLYSALYLIALAFLLPYEYLKRPGELRGRWIRERFGFPDPLSAARRHSRIWVHAVSVGEVIASVSLVKRIKRDRPSAEVVITTVTDTGQKVARERMGELATIVYVPFDLPFSVKNFIERIRPSLLIIMETELWPNVIGILKDRNIPVLMMNGRISGKSFQGYGKLRPFIRGVLGNLTLLCVQNELYAERLRLLGAAPEKIRVIGSLKFDTRPSMPVPGWTGMLEGPVLIAGSTHRTEEDLIADAYAELLADFPRLNLILAPRHPERFKEVEEVVRKKGLKYVKRSEIKDSDQLSSDSSCTTHHTPLVVILDVMGELSSVYGASDIAVMGGTFIGHGGQNPLEPAYWEKAIVCGPHMENFPFIDDFYRNGGAVKVDVHTLSRSLRELLNDPGRLAAMGKIAKGLYDKNAGTTERAAEIIEKYLR